MRQPSARLPDRQHALERSGIEVAGDDVVRTEALPCGDASRQTAPMRRGQRDSKGQPYCRTSLVRQQLEQRILGGLHVVEAEMA